MHEMKKGKLRSGSGKKVTNPKQAIAIALSEAREEGKKVPNKTAATKKSDPAKKAVPKKKTAVKKSVPAKKTAPAKKAKPAKKAAPRKKS